MCVCVFFFVLGGGGWVRGAVYSILGLGFEGLSSVLAGPPPPDLRAFLPLNLGLPNLKASRIELRLY